MRELLLTHRVNNSPLFRKLRQLTLLLSLLLVPQLAGAVDYDITIAGIQVTDGNAGDITGASITASPGGNGKVSFTPSDNTLTLDGVIISGSIVSELGNLNVLIKGNNTVSRSDTASVIRSNNSAAPLVFNKEGNATLTISNSGNRWPLIWNFASIEYATAGLSLISPMPVKFAEATRSNPSAIDPHRAQGLIPAYKDSYDLGTVTFTTAAVYPLWIAGTQVTEANKDNITNAATAVATFTPASGSTKAKLSLTNADITGNIISGVGDLEVYYSGASTITSADTSAVIRPMENDAKLYFTSASNSSLILRADPNIPVYSSTYSVIHSYNSIEISDGIYQETAAPSTYDNSSYNGLKNAIDGSPLYYLKLSTSPTYPLWVVGTQATSTTLNGAGWTYDNDNKKLTLSGATITGQIISGLGDLTIFLTGSTILKAAGSETSLISSTNGGVLTFETDATSVGSLEFQKSDGARFEDDPYSSFSAVKYGIWLDYDPYYKKIEKIQLKIGYGDDNNETLVDINNSNKDDVINDGGSVKYSFDFDKGHVLTLNNTSILQIWANVHADITISINGTNRVVNIYHNGAIYSNNGDIHFIKGSETAELTVTAGNSDPITSYTLGSGLYSEPISPTSTIITTNPEFVIIEDYVMTDTRTVTSTGTITYDTTNKVLTIDGFEKTDNSNSTSDPLPPTYIKSGVVGLTVKLKGNSEINYSRNANIFEAIGTGATILFDGTEGGKLDMQINSTSQPFGGFAEIKYNKLAYWNTTGNNHTIQAPTAPTMAPNANNEVELTKPYADGSIKYSIVYADGTAGVSEATYSGTPFAMAAPGTVTAWAEANNTTTSTVKGKYFGYKDAPFTMLANETKTPELIPTIETGDYIDYEPAGTPFTSSDDNIATFTAGANGGVITAKAFGNATLTTTMAYSGQTANVVILNYNNQIKTVVQVAMEFNNYVNFASGQSYATFCNTNAEDWTLPEGITAYTAKIPTSGNELILTPLTFIPGNSHTVKGNPSPNYIGILLKRDDISRTSFGTVTKLENASGNLDSDLIFLTANKATDGKQYILYKNEFVKATGTITGPCCYLEKPSTNTNPARGFVIEGGGDGSTAIDDTLINEEETGNGEWYDLQGRRIQKPTKAGLYIVNGKKVVINNK